MLRTLRHLLFLFSGLGFFAGIGIASDAPNWWNKISPHDLAGAPVPLSGQWVVVVFISPECPVANAQIPVLSALAAEFSPRGFDFIGAYSDATFDLPALRRHASDYALKLIAVDDRAQRFVRATGATYTPEVFVFSRAGELFYHGRIDDRVTDFTSARPAAAHEDLREILTALAAGRATPFAARPGFGCAIPALVAR